MQLATYCNVGRCCSSAATPSCAIISPQPRSPLLTMYCYFVPHHAPHQPTTLQVLFLSASEEINKKPEEYWTLVMDIAKRNSLGRIKRCGTIMGRDEGEELSAAQIMYPCMQCADIFYLKANPLSCRSAISLSCLLLSAAWLSFNHRHLKAAMLQADICQLGMDQRKVNMLAREYCDDIKRKLKPIIISHAMLPGLLEVHYCTISASLVTPIVFHLPESNDALLPDIPVLTFAGSRKDVQERPCLCHLHGGHREGGQHQDQEGLLPARRGRWQPVRKVRGDAHLPLVRQIRGHP